MSYPLTSHTEKMDIKTFVESAKKFRKDLHEYKFSIELKADGNICGKSGLDSQDSNDIDELMSIFGNIKENMQIIECLLLRREYRKLRESRQTDSGYSSHASTSSLRLSDTEMCNAMQQLTENFKSSQTIPTQETNVQADIKIDKAEEHEENWHDKKSDSLKDSDDSLNPGTIVAHPAGESSEEEVITETCTMRDNGQRFEKNDHRKALVFPDSHFDTTVENTKDDKNDDHHLPL